MELKCIEFHGLASSLHSVIPMLCTDRLGVAAAGNSMQSSPEMDNASLTAFSEHEYVP